MIGVVVVDVVEGVVEVGNGNVGFGGIGYYLS